MTDFDKFLGNAVVILAGWWAVHLLSKKRDVEKSRRDLVVKSSEHLDSLVTTLLTNAQKYHCDQRSELIEREIKMKLQDIAQQISALGKILDDQTCQRDCLLRVRDLRQTITGRHFEDEHGGPLDDNDTIVQEIVESVARFKRGLLNLRYRQYEIRRSAST